MTIYTTPEIEYDKREKELLENLSKQKFKNKKSLSDYFENQKTQRTIIDYTIESWYIIISITPSMRFTVVPYNISENGEIILTIVYKEEDKCNDCKNCDECSHTELEE